MQVDEWQAGLKSWCPAMLLWWASWDGKRLNIHPIGMAVGVGLQQAGVGLVEMAAGAACWQAPQRTVHLVQQRYTGFHTLL